MSLGTLSQYPLILPCVGNACPLHCDHRGRGQGHGQCGAQRTAGQPPGPALIPSSESASPFCMVPAAWASADQVSPG